MNRENMLSFNKSDIRKHEINHFTYFKEEHWTKKKINWKNEGILRFIG